MKQSGIFGFAFLLFTISFVSCKKTVSEPGEYKLSYGDSVLYLKNQAGDQIVYPTEHREGVYTAFPDGIEIDDMTGAINLSKSETGLRYRITHTTPDGKKTNTLVVVSGVNYTDKFYNLA